MQTNQLDQIGQFVPSEYQQHWQALVLLAGIVTHAAHMIYPRFIAAGGLSGVWQLFLHGKISSVNLDASATGKNAVAPSDLLPGGAAASTKQNT